MDRVTQRLWRAVEEPVPSVAEGTPRVLLNLPMLLSRVFFFKLPQNRHPERSASQMDRVTQRLWRGVEGPRRCLIYPCCLLGCFSSKHPQNCHPERSASEIHRMTQRLWRGVEGPRRCLIYPCCLLGCFSCKHPQNRHPERSASQMDRVTQSLWRGVEGPRRCLFCACCSELFDRPSPKTGFFIFHPQVCARQDATGSCSWPRERPWWARQLRAWVVEKL